MKKFIPCSIAVILLLTAGGNTILGKGITQVQVNGKEVNYQNNEDKNFPSAEEFLSKEVKTSRLAKYYEEYKDADLNIREKILFKDLEKTVKNNLGKIADDTIFNQPNIKVDRNKLIYFYSSVLHSKDDVKNKFILIDAETKEMLWAGNSYVKKDEKYVKRMQH